VDSGDDLPSIAFDQPFFPPIDVARYAPGWVAPFFSPRRVTIVFAFRVIIREEASYPPPGSKITAGVGHHYSVIITAITSVRILLHRSFDKRKGRKDSRASEGGGPSGIALNLVKTFTAQSIHFFG
jgi:hypothetical protein